jgi:hypothetical protein
MHGFWQIWLSKVAQPVELDDMAISHVISDHSFEWFMTFFLKFRLCTILDLCDAFEE